MNTHDLRWIHLEQSDGERLFRVKLSGITGVVALPDLGPVQFSRNNGQTHFAVGSTALQANDFADGDILVRSTREQTPRSAKGKSSHRVEMAIVILSLAVLGSRFVSFGPSVAKASIAPPSSPIQKVANVKPKAVVTPTVEIARNPQLVVASPKPQAVLKEPAKQLLKKETVSKREAVALKPSPKASPKFDWEGLERQARMPFLRGDFARAESILADVPMDRASGVPDKMRALMAEIQYAKCQKSYRAEHWAIASASCGRAVEVYRHARAFQILRQLGEKARRLYLEGYVMEGTNREAAIRRYQDVIAIARPKDPYRLKAAKKLKGFQASAAH